MILVSPSKILTNSQLLDIAMKTVLFSELKIPSAASLVKKRSLSRNDMIFDAGIEPLGCDQV